MDLTYAKEHIICDCGHLAKDHYLKEGCCDKCGCTWYWPNHKWINKNKIVARVDVKDGQ